jgi:hypothetical protein
MKFAADKKQLNRHKNRKIMWVKPLPKRSVVAPSNRVEKAMLETFCLTSATICFQHITQLHCRSFLSKALLEQIISGEQPSLDISSFNDMEKHE